MFLTVGATITPIVLLCLESVDELQKLVDEANLIASKSYSEVY